MTNSGTMFKITAKNCKDWADAVNKGKFSDLLTNLAEAARNGKYMLCLTDLPESYRDELETRGFIVTKTTPHKMSPAKPKYYIRWK